MWIRERESTPRGSMKTINENDFQIYGVDFPFSPFLVPKHGMGESLLHSFSFLISKHTLKDVSSYEWGASQKL